METAARARIVELAARNFGIIKEAAVEFDDKFTALTGETGAGKSLIVEAIGVAVGARPNQEMIGSGSDSARITAIFEILSAPDFLERARASGIEIGDDGRISLSRTIMRDGRHKAYINGAPVVVGQLRAIGSELIDIHGQSEAQSLFQSASQIDYLDEFIPLLDERASYRDLFDRYKTTLARRKDFIARAEEIERRIDYLKYQIDEIEKADLSIEEEGRLNAERARLAGADTLSQSAHEALENLDSNDGVGAISSMSAAMRTLEKAMSIDPGLKPIVETLRNGLIAIEEGAGALSAYSSSIEADPDRLEFLEARLDLLTRLKKKYGASIALALDHLDRAKTELGELENSVADSAELESELERLGAKTAELALSIDRKRREGAERFAKSVEATLRKLDMPEARFEVAFEYQDDPNSPCILEQRARKLRANGIGAIEFLFSANRGQPPRALSKIGSGGEISRTMLAIKSARKNSSSARSERIERAMVFDEIDSGVGGVAADKIGQELKNLARDAQALCVTHLAQVARLADNHLSITKKGRADQTEITITKLNKEQRVKELARMATGDQAREEALKWAEKALGRTESDR